VTQVFREWTENVVFRARERIDINKGLPYYDRETRIIYFRATDFVKQYKEKFKENTADRQIWSYMRDAGFSRKQLKIKTNPEWVWCYSLGSEEAWFILRDERF
jgi:hypothetical protein